MKSFKLKLFEIVLLTMMYPQSDMTHPTLTSVLAPVRELYDDVRRKALMRLEYEGLHRAEAIVSPGARFHNDAASYAMDRYAYYVCFKCKKVRKI
jgi:E3 ubiquitin-protein ligase MYCBP2